MLADPQARPHASLGSMFAVAVSTPAFVRTRISRATRAPARRTSRVVVRAAGSDGNAEDEDDLPPPIKLTADQARIAALAFEVLYEKDPREDMEEMLKDKERPGLRAKLQQAIKGAFAARDPRPSDTLHLFLLLGPFPPLQTPTREAKCSTAPPDTDTTECTPAWYSNPAANEACKDGATVECAAAWEEVDGLEDAAMRAGMTQNAPPGSPSAVSPALPVAAEKSAKKPAGAPKRAKKEDRRMLNPATMAGVDPLTGVMPCAGDSCEAPSGTFEARLELERALQVGGNAADEPTLTKAIRDAVDVAITMCENGEDASQCAVAWEVVEELSSSASKRRVDDVDADAN